MTILLDGQDFTQFISGVDEAKSDIIVTVTKKEAGRGISKKFTNELTFLGGPGGTGAFDYIKPILIDDPNGGNKSITIKMFDECCLDENGDPWLAFEGIIRGDSVDWCEGDCFCTGNAVEHTVETKKIDCLKSTTIFDNYAGFQSNNHPRMVYCDELRPNWLHHVVIILGIIVNIILLILTPIVAILSVIIQAICAIVNIVGGDCPDELADGILDDFQEFKELLNESIIGCGRVHPSPLVRNYINNVCNKCGIVWNSSILKNASSDYYNTVYMSAPMEKGTRDNTVKWIDENKPLLTGEGLLEQLTLPFNAEYHYVNGVLYFERKDFFYNRPIWVDYDTLKQEDRIEGKLCYQWRADEKSAFARFSYTPDPVDAVGNEAINFYSDIVEWNQPFNDLQKGQREVILPFGPTRWRKDGIDPDVLGNYEANPFYGNLISQFNDAIILQKGVAFQPRLLIWDGKNLGSQYNYVRKYTMPGYPMSPSQNYNFPYHFNEYNVAANTAYPPNQPNMGIYGRFYTIDHPKLFADKGKTFSMTFRFNCEELRNFDIFKNIQLPSAQGRINEVQINYSKRTMEITGDL